MSVGLRCFRLNDPGKPIFDEVYYVNAARDILGQHSVDSLEGPFHAGLDPNPQHPPLGKLFIAVGIRVFGDNPIGWRLPSILFGSLALLLLYRVVRTAGGSGGVALTAAGLMAVENLFFIHSRLATLDIFAVVFMLGAADLYLRKHRVLAGLAIGVGACTKLVAFDLLGVLLIFEVGRWLLRRHPRDCGRRWRPRALMPWAACAGVAIVVYLGLLGSLDHFVSARHNPIAHTQYMLQTLAIQTVRAPGPGLDPSPTSPPWLWLIDQEAINYYRLPKVGTAITEFRGVMTPVIIFAALPALVFALRAAWLECDELALLSVAWFAGTFGPFFLGGLLHRSSYLYYMVIVLPAVFIAIARGLWGRPRLPDAYRWLYGIGLLYNFVVLFPFQTALSQ